MYVTHSIPAWLVVASITTSLVLCSAGFAEESGKRHLQLEMATSQEGTPAKITSVASTAQQLFNEATIKNTSTERIVAVTVGAML